MGEGRKHFRLTTQTKFLSEQKDHTMKKTINKPKMKMIKEVQCNKHKVFDLIFSSTEDWKLDMLTDMLPKTFKRSETGSGYSFQSGKRDYGFRIRGYIRANALIKYFVTQMPRIKWKCFEKSEDTEFMNSNRKTK